MDKIEKRTLILLIIASAFNGFVIGTFNIQDVLAKKALQSLDWQITILVMLWPLSNLFSIWWGKALEHSRTLSKFFLITGFVGRLCLLLMLWVHNYYQYLIIMIVVFSFNALISPAQNSIYKNNLSPRNRGKIFGYAASILTLVAVIFSFFFGKLLDLNESLFRPILAFVGIAGFISSLLMAIIKVRSKKYIEQPLKFRELFLTPIRRTLQIFKKNKDFAIFQRNYFIYGIGFMIVLPAIPKYLVEILQMDYTQTFFAKGVISQLGILFLAPLAGKIHDKKNPANFSSKAFLLLGFYPLILFISNFFIETNYVNFIVYFSYLVFGIAMSAIMISWNISSIYFARKDDVSMYQSVHVSLTGLRALIVPFLGYLLLTIFNVQVVFLISVSMFWLASILNYRLYLKMCKKEFVYPGQLKRAVRLIRRIFPFG